MSHSLYQVPISTITWRSNWFTDIVSKYDFLHYSPKNPFVTQRLQAFRNDSLDLYVNYTGECRLCVWCVEHVLVHTFPVYVLNTCHSLTACSCVVHSDWGYSRSSSRRRICCSSWCTSWFGRRCGYNCSSGSRDCCNSMVRRSIHIVHTMIPTVMHWMRFEYIYIHYDMLCSNLLLCEYCLSTTV